MALVITEACRNCKHADCVEVCPADCIYQDEAMLYIDPDECLHCFACMPECPVEAIYPDDSVPEQWTSYIQLNAIRTKELIAQGVKPTTEKP
jgi:ferredoxin